MSKVRISQKVKGVVMHNLRDTAFYETSDFVKKAGFREID